MRPAPLNLPLDAVPKVGNLPAGSVIPVAPNPNFTGRDDELKTLAREIMEYAGETLTAVGIISTISGMGGVGKTQLAAEFAHRYGRFFPGGVQWINMAEINAVPAHVALCGLRMNLTPTYPNLTQPEQVEMVRQVWEGPEPRLLIFDNCENDNLLAHWRPKTGGCRLLVTSRQGVWNPGMGIRPLRLQTLTRPASVDLLHKFAPWLTAKEADAIANELGDLPLALHLAGSYLNVYTGDINADQYLEELRRAGVHHVSLSAVEGSYTPTQHDLHVGRTFALSYDKIGADPVAHSLLARLACLAPGQPVSPNLFLPLMQSGDAPAAKQAPTAALRRLHRLGLIEIGENEPAPADPTIAYLQTPITLHRLIASFLSREIDLDEIRPQIEKIVAEEADKINDAGLPAPLQTWVEHLRFVAETADKRESETASWLLDTLGMHLWIIADYSAARTAYERALEIAEDTLDPDHPNIAHVVNNLGLALQDLGDLHAARQAFERALQINETAFDPNHPDVAIDINNLGVALKELGELPTARQAFERALKIIEKHFDSEHPKVATLHNNLGLVLQDMGELHKARQAYERALKIGASAFGPDHPNIATVLNNLGYLLEQEGSLQGAKAAFQRALKIWEQSLGSDHPNTQSVKQKLASLQE